MENFYITIKDINIVFGNISKSTAGQKFRECKAYCNKYNIPLLDRNSVPTDAFCKMLKINKKDFVKTLKERKEVIENGEN